MTGLHVHRAERADALAEALGSLLAAAPPGPFDTEVVAVPARGVERWLAQRLSHRLGAGPDGGDGVCAGIAFPPPGAVVDGAVGAVTGVDPRTDPWAPERLVWAVLEVLDASAGEEWAAALGPHLAHRRLATARRLAELFASYARHRPELLERWRGGDPHAPPDLAWQPRLWCRVRERIGTPGPAERLRAACAELRARPERAGLPPRLSLFGPTRLPAAHVAVLVALAEHREVHLWLPHPSPGLWERVRPPAAPPVRDADPTAAAARHPLLASMGRDCRELQVRLALAAPDAVVHHHAGPAPPDTLLGRLQRELRDDAPPAAPVPPAPGDRSVQVHSCHGPDRQVEVLREVVLGLLDADPSLHPRDVLVMCPDIETFAPLVTAAFGLGERDGSHPGHRVGVRLADRALRQVNPLLDVVAQLLELTGARHTAAQLLDLLGAPPVRQRFDLDDDDLERLRELVVRSGVRWGLDGPQRGAYQLAGFRQNTWAAGLDRLLLGVATADESAHLGTALPYAELESGDTGRLGRLAEFVHRVGDVLDALAGEQPLAAWIAALERGLDLLTATAPADDWQAAQARAELAGAVRAAGPHAVAPLGAADVRALLAERLRGRPSRSGFRTGALTVATLVPMRSVPHRVVCLLGLDDGVFPRADLPDGDDLLARRPVVGERDPRAEDRQLLLDALVAATETLVVVHSGADERTGARRPPAVPLGELLDAVAATAGVDGLARVVVRHPLQPFDARNFTPGALGSARAFSFDRAELAGAVAAAGVKAPPPPFSPAPLPPVAAPVVALDELVAFLEHPVRGFLRQRVGLSLWAGEQAPADALPVEPDGLARWQVGERLLRDRLAGHDLRRCQEAEWRRGELPPGELGARLLLEVLDEVEPLVAAAAALRTGEAHDRDVDVELPDGTRLVGTLGGLHGRRLVRVEYARLRAKQRVRAWVRLLALSADPRHGAGEPWSAVTLGRAERWGLTRAVLAPVAPWRARALLADLVALRGEGLREPLPLALATAHAYARTRRSTGPGAAWEEAERTWSAAAAGERREDAHVLVWGPAAPGAVLTAEAGPPGGEPTRFGQLAQRLWAPLLEAEEVLRA